MKQLLLLLLALGCSPEVIDSCPQVQCAFAQGVCSPGMSYRSTTHFDDGHGCWYRTATCYPEGTLDECIPADCYEEIGAACQ